MSNIPYQAAIDVENKNNSHTRAFDFIVSRGRLSAKVLEIGCSTGYFGAALARFGYEVDGVEPYLPAAEEAKKLLNFVYPGNFDAFIESHSDRRYDFIVFGDVLEHLADPLSALKAAQHLLNQDGYIVCSVPNVTHGTVRSMLLSGNWEYQDLGILDRTHLRFFSRETFISLLTAANLEIDYFEPIKVDQRTANSIVKLPCSEQAIDTVSKVCLDKDIDSFQFVAMAHKASNGDTQKNSRFASRKPISILAANGAIDSSLTQIRIGEPLRLWAAATGNTVCFKTWNKITLQDIANCDLLVVQRDANRKVMRTIKLARALGKKIIFEIDDLLTDLPPFLNHHHSIIKNERYIKMALSTSDAITTTTSRLADKIKSFNSKVHVIQNCAYLGDRPPARHNSPNEEPITFVIASSDSVIVDYVIPACREIIHISPRPIRIVTVGPIAKAFRSASIPLEQHNLMTRGQFFSLLTSIQNPVGLIPLDNSPFSQCKSPVKFYDYSAAGVVSICSNTPPYADYVRNNIDGILVENTDTDWLQAMLRMVEDDALRVRLTTCARSSALQLRNVSGTTPCWDEAIASVLSSTREPASNQFSVIGKGFQGAALRVSLELSSSVQRIKDINRRRLDRRRRGRLATP